MRLLTGFLIFLLILTACATPAPATPTEFTAPTPEAVTLDGTLENSLIVSTWRDGPKGNVLFPLDPASGTALSGYEPIALGYSSLPVFSPDRQTVAIVSFPDENTYNGDLLLIDLPTWKVRRLALELRGWVSGMAFSPNGQQLAIAHGDYHHKLTMVNIAQGVIMAQEESDTFISRLKFTQSSETLMLYKPSVNFTNGLSPDPPQVFLLDAQKLNTLWSAELEGVRDGMFPKDETITQPELYEPGNASYFTPALTFAPDRDTLYIVHADSEQLTTVDFRTQKVKTVNIQPKLSWFEQLLSLDAGVAHAKIADGTMKQTVISPDGQFLYVTGVSYASYKDQEGVWQVGQTPLGLEILQTSDGSRVERMETDATELSLSPDGRFLYLRHWGDEITLPWTEIFDTSSRKLIERKEAFYATPVLLMSGRFLLASTYVSPESKYAEQYHMSILQPSDLSVLADWVGPDFVYWPTP
ncbi:MAG TPA: hypothetical protein VFQ13_01800 [Anaerolineales bacterium]|nr:hypothetical protein [Anaerolineales bacterium]